MPIGKDSIKTRVAKVAPAEDTAKAETPAEVKPAKAPAKKAAAPKAPKAPKAEGETAKAPAKKAATKKPAAPKAPKAPKAEAPVAVETPAPVAEAPVVETAVLANVAPETVAAVIGHDEKKPADKVQIGQKMPNYLL